jgi:Oxidoreductase family, NAD-binding Rossmann fold
MSRSKNKHAPRRLGVGFVGSGFNARFHMQAFRAVRDADVRGAWSPNLKHAASAAALARSVDIGEAKPCASIGDLVADPAIDALWLTGSNHTPTKAPSKAKRSRFRLAGWINSFRRSRKAGGSLRESLDMTKPQDL